MFSCRIWYWFKNRSVDNLKYKNRLQYIENLVIKVASEIGGEERLFNNLVLGPLGSI